MNVGHPSNLARIIAFYNGVMDESGRITKAPDLKQMREDFFAVSVTDEETRDILGEVYRKYNILLEPHGAVAWKGVREYFRSDRISKSGKQLCIALETAHPAKFPDELRQIINVDPLLPASLIGLEQKPENYVSMENNYELLKNFILNNY